MNQEALNAETRINRGALNYRPLLVGSQIVRRSKRVFKAMYNFSTLGGAIGTIPLVDPVFSVGAGTLGGAPALGGIQGLCLPASFIITNVLIDCVTAFVGTGASVALTSGQNAGDLLATTAISSAPFVAGTIVAGIPVSAATAIKIPSTQAQPGSAVAMVISGAALTAGQLNVHIEGFLSDLY
jgi:hypothetical protein